LRNPFGGAWRAADGKHYEVENGPSTDRFVQINPGVDYLWDGDNSDMFQYAIYNWNPAHAPVNIDFIQSTTFAGSQFPAGKLDHAFVSESGPTYATGPQARGKRIVEFVINASGGLVSGPTTLVEYVGDGQGTVVGLAAGPDGLYFTELYKDLGAVNPTDAGARIFRVRYVNPLAGDYDLNGIVDQNDQAVWKANYGSNLLLAADGNHNGMVDAADYIVWRNNLGAGSATSTVLTSEPSISGTVQNSEPTPTGIVQESKPSPSGRGQGEGRPEPPRATAFASLAPPQFHRVAPRDHVLLRRVPLATDQVHDAALLAVLADRGRRSLSVAEDPISQHLASDATRDNSTVESADDWWHALGLRRAWPKLR